MGFKNWLIFESLEISGQGALVQPCEHITGSALDFCCSRKNVDCCETAGWRFRAPPEEPEVWASFVGGQYSVVGTVVSASEAPSSTSSSSLASSMVDAKTVTVSEQDGAEETGGNSSNDGANDVDGGGSASLSTEAKAGIGIGASIGALLLIAVIWLAYKYRRQRNANISAQSLASPRPAFDSPQP